MYFTIEKAQKYIKDSRHIYEEELHLDSLKHCRKTVQMLTCQSLMIVPERVSGWRLVGRQR